MKKVLFLFVSLFAVQVAMADEETIASFTFPDQKLAESGSATASGVAGTGCTIDYAKIGGVDSKSVNQFVVLETKYYHKLTNATSAWIKIKLTTGKFQAGDKFSATMFNKKASVDGFYFKGSGGTNNKQEITYSATEENVLNYTLTDNDINDDGSLTLYRVSSNCYVRHIEITRSSSTKEDATTEFTNAYWGFALSAGTNAGQTVTTNSTGAVTYSSSNTGVVTVNEETGALTAEAVGKAVITANVAADDTYYASAADYTVYVLSDGTGTWAKPYLPTDFRYLAEAGETASNKWVKGYIVGVWNSTEKDVKILSNSTTGTNNNIGLANTLSEDKGSSCLTVRLNSAPDIQQYINLKDNSDKYHQEVYVKGNIGSFTFSSNTVYGMPTPVDFRYGEESLDVTIGATGYATFSAMRGYALPDEMDAYTVSSYADGKVTLTKIAEKIVPAFTGVILKGTSDTMTADETEVSLGGNNMKYNVKAKVMTETETIDEVEYTNFILVPDGDGGVKFAKVSGGTLDANKSYLQLPTESLAGARELSIMFDDGVTTGISAALMNNERMNNEVYNLAGQRVAQPTKGLYIVNGKKYIVK